MRIHDHARRSSFTRLIRFYTAVISVMVVLATGVFILVSLRSYNAEVQQAENTAERQISQRMGQNQQTVSQFATQITESASNLASIQKYFEVPLSTYSDYAIDKSFKGTPYFFWPTESRQFFIQHDQVEQLTLRLLNSKRVFVATPENPGGTLVKESTVHQRFAISAPIINQYTLETDGVISVSFDQSELKRQFQQLSTLRPIQIAVQSEANDQVFYFAGKHVPESQRRAFKRALTADNLANLSAYRVSTKNLPAGYRLTLVVNRNTLRTLLVGHTLPIIVLGLVLLLGLSIGLWLTFRRYQHQLASIVQTVTTVSAGDFDARVPLDLKSTDLHTLAVGINVMLEEIHQHIETIYQLQVAQQEANRKALQAQINPHFMANTLEYIRMAALDADQPDLANVVYSFAALLRNNTDLSPRTTMAQELSFIEKYVFLYQVRFPDQLAYQIKIDPAIADVEVPKFSLQPLVENYFVHGIDFTRQDNALSIKTWREGPFVKVKIINNGRSLTAREVQQLNVKMRAPLDSEQHQSIGLQNVYSRMRDYFGASFAMKITSDGQHGVIVKLQFIDRPTAISAAAAPHQMNKNSEGDFNE